MPFFRCAIKMCKTNPNRDENATNITFHKFPTDDFKRKRWMEALKLDKIKPSAVICSDHFQPNDFISDSTKNKTRLYPSAVPFLRNDVEESLNCFAIENNSGHQMKIFDTCKPIVRSLNPPNSGNKFGESKPVVWNVKTPLNTGIEFVDSKTINNNVTPNKPQVFFVQPPSASKILPKEDKPPNKPLIVFIDPSSTLSKSGPIVFDPSSSSKILTNDDNTKNIMPVFINPTSTCNILPTGGNKTSTQQPDPKIRLREEKMKLKIETLKQSESKSRHKVKILHQKIRRHTRSLNCLQQKVANLKQTMSERGKRGCLVQNPIKQIKLPKLDNKPTPIPNPPDLTFTNPTYPKVDNKPTPIPNPPDFDFTRPTTSPTNIELDQSEELQETANEVSEFDQGRLIFEVNFKNNELFNEYKDFVIEGLRLSLTDKGLFILVEDDTKIQVYREFAVVNEEEEKVGESAGTIQNQIGSVVEVKCDEQNQVHHMPKIDDDQENLNHNNMPEIDHYQQTLNDPVTKVEIPKLQDDIQISFKNEDIPVAGVLTVETQPSERINSMLNPPKEIIIRTPQQISLLRKRKIQGERERLKQKKPNLNVILSDHNPQNRTKIYNDKRKSINLRPDRYLDHHPKILDWKSILSKDSLG